ncbi:Drosophila melanogaster Klp31E gene product, partial [Plasmodium yoelii yoelii]
MIDKKQKTNNVTFDTSCTYIEIYNEEIIDLIDFSEEDYDEKIGNKCNTSTIGTFINNKDLKINNKKKNNNKKINKNISIREDINKKEIILMGVKTAKVSNVDDSFAILHKGNLLRTTERTFMNDKSSRSHAIFTINLIQKKKVVVENGVTNEINVSGDVKNGKNGKKVNQRINNDIKDSTNASLNERVMTTSESNNANKIEENEKKEEIICSKLHFVDLAGSERAKRTETKGNRLKEAININYGLLSLSNVIYGLSSKKKVQHIPYRNSKLTRILQDSLGGNSKTIMIACISIEPSDFYETFSTVKYAARTKKIKNNPIINYDINNLIINDLRKQLFNLNLELKKYKVECKDKYNFADDKKLKELSDQNCILLKKIKNLNIKRKKLMCLIFYYISLIRKSYVNRVNSPTCSTKDPECCISPKSVNIENDKKYFDIIPSTNSEVLSITNIHKNDKIYNLNSIENSKICCQSNYLDNINCKKEDNNEMTNNIIPYKKNKQTDLEFVNEVLPENDSTIKRIISSTDNGVEKNEKEEESIKLNKVCGMCEKINIIEGNEESNDFDFSFLENKYLFLNLEKDKKYVEDIFRQYELNKFNEKKLNDLNKKYINIFEKNKGYEKKINELNKIIKKMKKGSKVKLNEKYNKGKGVKSGKDSQSKNCYKFFFSKKDNDKKKMTKKKIKKNYNNNNRHNIDEDTGKSINSLNKLKSVYNLFWGGKIRKGYYSEIELEREIKNKIKRKKTEKEIRE